MAWRTLTEDDLLTVLSGPELQGVREAALSDGQVDPVAPTLAMVVDLVRGYVGACARNTLGDGATIPQKLVAPACDIAAARILSRVGHAVSPGRDTAHNQAINLLGQVADCRFHIEEAATPSAEPGSASSPSISARTQTFKRSNQDGI